MCHAQYVVINSGDNLDAQLDEWWRSMLAPWSATQET